MADNTETLAHHGQTAWKQNAPVKDPRPWVVSYEAERNFVAARVTAIDNISHGWVNEIVCTGTCAPDDVENMLRRGRNRQARIISRSAHHDVLRGDEWGAAQTRRKVSWSNQHEVHERARTGPWLKPPSIEISIVLLRGSEITVPSGTKANASRFPDMI